MEQTTIQQILKILKPAGAVLGALMVAVGYILIGKDIISLGLPIWAWQAIGAAIFFISVIAIIYGHQKAMSFKTSAANEQATKGQVKPSQKTPSFLENVLAFNQQKVYEAVKGKIVKWNFSALKVAEGPYFEIHLSFVNTSIFTLDIKGLDGTIKVDGVPCFTKPTANVPQNSIIQGQEFYVIITQGVLPEMAKKILKLNDASPIRFDLSQLELVIETTTKGYEGLKPRIKFESYTPDINIWLGLRGDKLGYWG